MTRKRTIAGACLGAFAFLALAPAASADPGWQVRLRGIVVEPDESATITPIGGDASIDTAVMPELDITYFFTDNIAAELILAVSPHNPVAVGTSLGDVPLGDVTLLPPTLTLQYHPIPDNKVSPYAGVGVNYTVFFDTDVPTGGAVTSINYDDSFGFAIQGGVDIKLDDNWLLNLDVKKLWLNTDVSINGGAITADVDINPWIFGFGVGYRF